MCKGVRNENSYNNYDYKLIRKTMNKIISIEQLNIYMNKPSRIEYMVKYYFNEDIEKYFNYLKDNNYFVPIKNKYEKEEYFDINIYHSDLNYHSLYILYEIL